jgi:hypothetical protein
MGGDDPGGGSRAGQNASAINGKLQITNYKSQTNLKKTMNKKTNDQNKKRASRSY